jgi:hypothetical protein
MYKNFKEYWSVKEDLFKQLGISKEVAHMIWCDAVDALVFELIQKEIEKQR